MINKLFLFIFILNFDYAAHSKFSSFRNIATGSGVFIYNFWQYLLYKLEKDSYLIMQNTNQYIEKQIKSNEENVNKQIINHNKTIIMTCIVPFLLVIFKYIFYKITNKKNKVMNNK